MEKYFLRQGVSHRPKILFADEPAAEPDGAMGAEVVRLFQEMCRKEHVTIVLLSHDVGPMGAGAWSLN